GQLGNEPRVVVRLTEPSACDKLVEVFLEQMSISTTPASHSSTWQSEQMRLTKLDTTTLMIEQLPRGEGNQSQLPPPIFRRPAWADEWQGAADKQAVVVFDLAKFRAQTPPEEQARMLG